MNLLNIHHGEKTSIAFPSSRMRFTYFCHCFGVLINIHDRINSLFINQEWPSNKATQISKTSERSMHWLLSIKMNRCICQEKKNIL